MPNPKRETRASVKEWSHPPYTLEGQCWVVDHGAAIRSNVDPSYTPRDASILTRCLALPVAPTLLRVAVEVSQHWLDLGVCVCVCFAARSFGDMGAARSGDQHIAVHDIRFRFQFRRSRESGCDAEHRGRARKDGPIFVIVVQRLGYVSIRLSRKAASKIDA